MEPQRPASPYRPYSRLVEITIQGRKVRVPENNLLLRAFQFLCPEPISYGHYCWNEECQYCRVAIRRPGDKKLQQALSCKAMVEEGMEVSELSAELRWNLHELLRAGENDSSPQS